MPPPSRAVQTAKPSSLDLVYSQDRIDRTMALLHKTPWDFILHHGQHRQAGHPRVCRPRRKRQSRWQAPTSITSPRSPASQKAGCSSSTSGDTYTASQLDYEKSNSCALWTSLSSGLHLVATPYSDPANAEVIQLA